MKTNHDGTVTLNAYDTWTACLDCGQRVTGDSIHTCSPQLKTLTDEEILESFAFYFGSTLNNKAYNDGAVSFAKDILRKAQEK
jgi:hypothetical protein